AAHLVGSTLVVNGSTGDDRIEVERHGHKIVVEDHEHALGTFSLADVSLIIVNGLAGNDRIRISKGIDINTILFRGSGNDVLKGGGGNGLLVGGLGDDTLFGGRGRNVEIGGPGSDKLHGGPRSDLLIGNSTVYDRNLSALLSVFAEWTSSDSFSVRMNKLEQGLGVPRLDASTVLEDSARDDVFGEADLDWFFATAADKVHGKHG